MLGGDSSLVHRMGAGISNPAVFQQVPGKAQPEANHALDAGSQSLSRQLPVATASSLSSGSFGAVSSDSLVQVPLSVVPETTVNKSTSIDHFRLEGEIGTQTSETSLAHRLTTVPPAAVPPAAVPPAAVPPAAVPSATVPPVTVPPAAVPPAAVPPAAVPPATVPPAVVPLATVPPAAVHAAIVPAANVPPVMSTTTEGHVASLASEMGASSAPIPVAASNSVPSHSQFSHSGSSQREIHGQVETTTSGYGDRYQPHPYPDHAQSFHSRPHSRAAYEYPDYTHPPPPQHLDYGSYYQGHPGYDPYYDARYGDPYNRPPPPHLTHDPNYDPYRYGQSGYYQGYPPPTDPRYGYGPPSVQYPHQPTYDHSLYYAGDIYSQTHQYAPPPHADPYLQSQVTPYQQQQLPGDHPQSMVQVQEVENLPVVEPSIIQGESAGGFEISQVFSPNSAPGRPSVPPLESTALDQTNVDHAPHQGGQLLDASLYYGNKNTDYSNDPYPSNLPGEHHLEGDFHQQPEATLDTEQVPEAWEPITATPPPPERTTPHRFHRPHVKASFGFGGQLITVLPMGIGDQNLGRIEIQHVQCLLKDSESQKFVEAVSDCPDPFVPRETPKSVVYNFATRNASQCSESDSSGGEDEDEGLLWEFLKLLCQQNGVMVPNDVADLLMEGRTLAIKPSSSQSMDAGLDSLRQLLLSGRKKKALEFACAKGMWGHALMLASRMDDQSRNYVVNRFTASLPSVDPLNTFYTLLLGRTPAAVKQEGLPRAGDWRPHLSMILANKTSKLDNEAIVSLGDTLLAAGKVSAAHLCYYLADVHFGAYGDDSSHYSLLGVDQAVNRVGWYPSPQQLRKMEVLEYAMGLSRGDFAFPSFQLFKLLHVLKLTELGFVHHAIKYCEQICHTVQKGVDRYVPVMLKVLLDISMRLYHHTTEYGLVPGELPSWLKQLERSVMSILSTDYSPRLFSPSPVFSSVSQSYSNGGGRDLHPRLTIGLQKDTAETNLLEVPSHQAATSSLGRLEDRGLPYGQETSQNGDGLVTMGGTDHSQLMPSAGLTLTAPPDFGSRGSLAAETVGQSQLQQDSGTNNQNEVQPGHVEAISGVSGMGNRDEVPAGYDTGVEQQTNLVQGAYTNPGTGTDFVSSAQMVYSNTGTKQFSNDEQQNFEGYPPSSVEYPVTSEVPMSGAQYQTGMEPDRPGYGVGPYSVTSQGPYATGPFNGVDSSSAVTSSTATSGPDFEVSRDQGQFLPQEGEGDLNILVLSIKSSTSVYMYHT